MFHTFLFCERKIKLYCIEAGNKHSTHIVIFFLVDIDSFFSVINKVPLGGFRFILIHKYELLNQSFLINDLTIEIKKLFAYLQIETTHCILHSSSSEKVKYEEDFFDLFDVITIYKKLDEIRPDSFLTLKPFISIEPIGLIEEVSLHLHDCLAEGEPYLSKVAKKMGLTPRSLSAKLGKENLDFRVLVRKKRIEEAVNLLKDRNIKLYEIAYRLGYTECSAFTRAFRSWVGCSPSKFRRSLNYIC